MFLYHLKRLPVLSLMSQEFNHRELVIVSNGMNKIYFLEVVGNIYM